MSFYTPRDPNEYVEAVGCFTIGCGVFGWLLYLIGGKELVAAFVAFIVGSFLLATAKQWFGR